MLKVCYSYILYRRISTELSNLQGTRNEMIVSSFIYVSPGQIVSTQGPDNVPVLRLGEHHRVQVVVQEGYL